MHIHFSLQGCKAHVITGINIRLLHNSDPQLVLPQSHYFSLNFWKTNSLLLMIYYFYIFSLLARIMFPGGGTVQILAMLPAFC